MLVLLFNLAMRCSLTTFITVISLCFWWHSGKLTLNSCQLICSWTGPLTSPWKEASNRIKMKSKKKKRKGKRSLASLVGEPTKSTKHISKFQILNTQILTDGLLNCLKISCCSIKKCIINIYFALWKKNFTKSEKLQYMVYWLYLWLAS